MEIVLNSRNLLFFIIAVIFLGCQNNNVVVESKPVEVGIVLLKEQTIPLEQELSGRTKASVIAEVRPEVSGIVKKVVFKEGQKVKKGDILYEINPDVYKSAYDGANASLQSAKANFEALKLKKARYDELIKFEGISKQEHDDIVAAYLQAEAFVGEKEAALNKAKIDLQKTKISAAISGIIGISSVTEGALVTALQNEPLSTIRFIDTMYVDLSQSSNQLLALKKLLNEQHVQKGSMEVRLKLLDDSFYEHKGVLKLQEIAVDEGTSTVTLRAEFPNPNSVLLPGMYVRAVIEEAVSTKAFLVPQQAVSRDSRANPIITIVNKDNSTVTKIIETKRVIGNKWLVTGGVENTDKIIIEGLNKINSRSKVTAVDVTDKYIGE
ncbi:MAG: efflux RND transporter periplasmic adaptor subunit [Campylobacteraceae bacterium]|jgi:membrane fusion protein (multidrug efflux system)|nr:efflux RND transporter periplasmic adaptor subunit [Campylobacteraceae bacterium]